MFNNLMVGASSIIKKEDFCLLTLICFIQVCIMAAIMGEYADSYLGWFTIVMTAGFLPSLTFRGTSSLDKTKKSCRELIFLKALASVLLTPAVCLSESIPLIKELAMLLEVRLEFKKATSFFVDIN